jgi:hypothetical protein
MDPVTVNLTAASSVDLGGTLTLTALTTGDLVDAHMFTFYRQLRTTGEWKVIGPSQTSGTLLITDMTESGQTMYKVLASGKVNGKVFSSPVMVNVNDPVSFAPGTTVKSLTLSKGESSEFKVTAYGSDIQYAWYFRAATSSEWKLLKGVESDTCPLNNVTADSAGSYGVKLHNGFSDSPAKGSDPREIGRLFVNSPPTATLLAASSTVQVAAGSQWSVAVSVGDTIAGRVNYQWRKDGKSITGPNTNGSVLILGASSKSTIQFDKGSVSVADSGYYDVLVSNAYGASVSAGVRVIVNPAPIFNTQPVSMLASVNGAATFRSEVVGTGSLTFIWERWDQNLNGGSWTAVSGGTQSVLNLKGLKLTDNDTLYHLKVVSDYGTTYSSDVKLLVSEVSDLRFETNPTLVSGSANGLRAGAEGLELTALVSDKSGSTQLSYRWRKDGKDVSPIPGVASRLTGGSYNLTYKLPTVDNDTDGNYDVVVDNGGNFAASTSLALVVDPKIESIDVPLYVNVGDSAKMGVVVRNPSGKATYDYQWYRNGLSLEDGTLFSGAKTSELTLKAAPVDWKDGSQFYVEVVNTGTKAKMLSPVRTLGVVAPVELSDLLGPVSINAGGIFSLSADAKGGGEIKYQWLLDGRELPGETQSLLKRANASVDDAGVYQVRVSNAIGVVYSNLVTVTVMPELKARIETPDPVPLGGSINLVGLVSGLRSDDINVEYEWTLNGKLVSKTASSQLRITSVSVLDAGSYRLRVTRSGETALSESVELKVKKVPVVTVAPVSRIVASGTSVTFAVAASSATTLTYQWSRDGAPIDNAIGSSYRIEQVTKGHAGQYTVKISNELGSVEATARLTVLDAGSVVPPSVRAGATGTGLQPTSWWVYWVEGTASDDANDRNGFWLLERISEGVVKPGRSIWVWGSRLNFTETPVVYEWAAKDQFVQDAISSDRNEFSVVADRLPAESYTLAGKLEGLGDAAIFGAPEVIKGAYNGDTEPLEVSMSWDSEQVNVFNSFGSPDNLREMKDRLTETLQRELATIAGE